MEFTPFFCGHVCHLPGPAARLHSGDNNFMKSHLFFRPYDFTRFILLKIRTEKSLWNESKTATVGGHLRFQTRLQKRFGFIVRPQQPKDICLFRLQMSDNLQFFSYFMSVITSRYTTYRRVQRMTIRGHLSFNH